MSVRGIDSDGDWTFGKGIANYLFNDNEISQNIKTRVLEWKGDCFFNTNAGVDWINRLGSKDTQLLDSAIRLVIIQTEGVLQVTNTNIELKDRVLTVNYSIKTINSRNAIGSIQTTIGT